MAIELAQPRAIYQSDRANSITTTIVSHIANNRPSPFKSNLSSAKNKEPNFIKTICTNYISNKRPSPMKSHLSR